jgi:hypothetical protein
MSRFVTLLILAGALLAGVFAFRRGPGVAAAHVATPRVATSVSHVAIPRRPMVVPPRPIANPVNDTTLITVINELAVRGETRFVITRVSMEGDALVVSAPDGSIPAFASEDSAREWAARVLPTATNGMDARFLAGLGRAIAKAQAPRDLDGTYAWTTAPRRDALAPDALLGAWTLLATAGEVPEALPGDPMGITMARGESGDRVLTEQEALQLALMKADLVRRGATRARKGDANANPWPPSPYWTAADAAHIARAMQPALEAFAARLTDDVDRVALTLVAR